ncbi:MAG: hypothetical protein HY538_05185 [Deltaproteobacteria bacterium]|nr:hypothetical protein [Deltaproteobacteria bacterium]
MVKNWSKLKVWLHSSSHRVLQEAQNQHQQIQIENLKRANKEMQEFAQLERDEKNLLEKRNLRTIQILFHTESLLWKNIFDLKGFDSEKLLNFIYQRDSLLKRLLNADPTVNEQWQYLNTKIETLMKKTEHEGLLSDREISGEEILLRALSQGKADKKYLK